MADGSSGASGGRVGEQVGSYRLLEVLGRGGMGEVWLAEHVTIRSRVAIKLILAGTADDDAAERFLREAKATARIRHPGVVMVTDYGPREDGGAYLVMELLDGESLAQRLARGAVAVDLAIDLATQIAQALDAAHGAGVVHRDLKPGNVFLVDDPAARSSVRVKLVDFGVAKATGRGTDELAMTATGALVGTPLYMAPEQCTSRRGPIDHRADLYALGVVLYELLTGRPPFTGPTLGDLIDQHLNATPTPPRALRPEVPARLELLIVRLLAKEADERPATAAAVAATLRTIGTHASETGGGAAAVAVTAASSTRAVSGLGVTVDSAVGRTLAAEAPLPVAPPATAAPIGAAPRRRWWIVGAGALVAAAVVTVWFGRHRGSSPRDPVAACERGNGKTCRTLVAAEWRKPKPELQLLVRWTQAGCDRADQAMCRELARMMVWGIGLRADLPRARALATAACDGGDGASCDLAADLLSPGPQRAAETNRLLRRGCDLGDPRSCLAVGRRLRHGIGAPADAAATTALLERSMTLARASCDRDEPEACRVLGTNYVRGDGVAVDTTRALGHFQRACELGSAAACGELAELHTLGTRGIAKDPVQARRYFELACDRGETMACVSMALAMTNGLLGPAEPDRAFAIIKHACEERSPRVCGLLGNLHSMGMGTPVDPRLARAMYRRACDASDADSCAQYALAEVPGETIDPAAVQQALVNSCELGSAFGCWRLGKRLSEAKDLVAAVEKYRIACALSDQQIACGELSAAYFRGEGVTANAATGRQILEQACDVDAQAACHVLGLRLRKGSGLPVDLAESSRVLDKACSLGWAASCVALAELLDGTFPGLTADPPRAKALREQACALNPSQYCAPPPAASPTPPP